MDHTPTPLSRSPARTPLRHLADLLSTANAVCGIVSCGFAVVGRPDVSLVLLLVGAVCDGLDGAAARRFGGTRFGVLADDAADAISYAIAPAIAVAVTVSGDAGTIIGVAFGALTVLRLVFFTLKKGAADTDPAVFRGMPSTVGGVVVLSAAILWPQAPAAVAFVAGAAVVFMVSFDAPFAHLGRVLGGVARGDRQRLGTVTVGVAAVAVALGPVVLATVCLSCAAVYAAAPVVGHLRRAAAEWHQRTVGQNGM
jgi:CDP-diacylglycerol--serine O-phosphatidyltransferase